MNRVLEAVPSWAALFIHALLVLSPLVIPRAYHPLVGVAMLASAIGAIACAYHRGRRDYRREAMMLLSRRVESGD